MSRGGVDGVDLVVLGHREKGPRCQARATRCSLAPSATPPRATDRRRLVGGDRRTQPARHRRYRIDGKFTITDLPSIDVTLMAANGYGRRRSQVLASTNPTPLDIELRPITEGAQKLKISGVSVAIADETILTLDDSGAQLTVQQCSGRCSGRRGHRRAWPAGRAPRRPSQAWPRR